MPMIIKCIECGKYFDDQFRSFDCPHNTFPANDGQNNFKHYPESWLSKNMPSVTIKAGEEISEYNQYRRWLDKNRIRY